MWIDLLLQKTVVHNFFADCAKYVSIGTVHIEMESSRSSTQTMTTTSSNIVKTFV